MERAIAVLLVSI
jgi:hypothetical protein